MQHPDEKNNGGSINVETEKLFQIYIFLMHKVIAFELGFFYWGFNQKLDLEIVRSNISWI